MRPAPAQQSNEIPNPLVGSFPGDSVGVGEAEGCIPSLLSRVADGVSVGLGDGSSSSVGFAVLVAFGVLVAVAAAVAVEEGVTCSAVSTVAVIVVVAVPGVPVAVEVAVAVAVLGVIVAVGRRVFVAVGKTMIGVDVGGFGVGTAVDAPGVGVREGTVCRCGLWPEAAHKSGPVASPRATSIPNTMSQRRWFLLIVFS
jgi:hypothetical protein